LSKGATITELIGVARWQALVLGFLSMASKTQGIKIESDEDRGWYALLKDGK
jgi:hypothetical protein